VVRAKSKITSIALAIGLFAWVLLLLGILYAAFFVTEPPPNPVITFSARGLTRLLTELLSLGIGCLGLLLTVVAFILAARNRALALAAVANAAVCAVCVALLM